MNGDEDRTKGNRTTIWRRRTTSYANDAAQRNRRKSLPQHQQTGKGWCGEERLSSHHRTQYLHLVERDLDKTGMAVEEVV